MELDAHRRSQRARYAYSDGNSFIRQRRLYFNQSSGTDWSSVTCGLRTLERFSRPLGLDLMHQNYRPRTAERFAAFSRNADELLYCGPQAGVGKLDVRGLSNNEGNALVLWKEDAEVCDVAKYSPSAFIFATLTKQQVKVWRMRRKIGEPDQHQTLYKVEQLRHTDPVVYFSWKPSLSQWHSNLETDGTRKAQWFEPQRILLTCTVTRSVRIWTEMRCGFEPVLVFDTMHPIDNVRWVMTKNRNISDEAFGEIKEDHDQADWISGVDQHGILRLWRLAGIDSAHPKVEETMLQIQVSGEDDKQNFGVGLGEACVMAYFSQNHFGRPSKLEIVLQRADHIMLSFHVAVGQGDRPSQILKKSWHRSHLGSISALSAHPSLPLIASVDTYASEFPGLMRNEILVYWISFSAFSADTRLIPSGVLPCEDKRGDVLCIQWVPTLHFDATPLILVAYKSGYIDVYGRSPRADVAVVSSPKIRSPKHLRILTSSTGLSSLPHYDYVTEKHGFQYEVACEKRTMAELGLYFEEKNGRFIVSKTCSSNKYLSDVIEGDELIAINNDSVVGKNLMEVYAIIGEKCFGESLHLSFRAACKDDFNGTKDQKLGDEESHESMMPALCRPTSSTNSRDDAKLEHSGKEHTSNLEQEKGNFWFPCGVDDVIHAGAVSMYGGWKHLFHSKVAPKLALLCVCPSYADDGEYVPDSVLIFGIESLPGKLSVWKGVRGGAYQSFEVTQVHIQGVAFQKKANITSLACERDYRQRAFTSKRARTRNILNSLLFVGDLAGYVEHWRCQLIDDYIQFTVMSSSHVGDTESMLFPGSYNVRAQIGSFCRRGYVLTGQVESLTSENAESAMAGSIVHIEVDDPNRVVVLRADRPEDLYIFEAESGLGILRLEESISSNGRGNVLGFTWCTSHVEFNVDALAVRYESATVIYHYDMALHRWIQIGNDVMSPAALFDCTRDSSALMFGGGHLYKSLLDQHSPQLISNEMPVVIGNWDEPGSLLQHSMDWKVAELPQKLPVWHPYVLLTTMFGMHARVGKKDTSLAGDHAAFEFSRAFGDATQMLKLLAKVLNDESSARASASHGILSYTGPACSMEKGVGDEELGRARIRESIGRYSTSIHRSDQIDKAENLFAAQMSKNGQKSFNYGRRECCSDEDSHRTLLLSEAETILAAIESMLQNKKHELRQNALILFASFSEENLLEMKMLLHFVDAIQSLGFDLDASAADLGAKRFISMNLLAKSLKSVVLTHSNGKIANYSSNPQNGEWDGNAERQKLHSNHENDFQLSSLEEMPSSGILWALHSDAQRFLWEHCIQPQTQWDEVRPLWLGIWIKDVKFLREIVEWLAKLSYARSKNAMDVCLLYVAVGKKNVLSALANLSQSESNKTLASFLKNNFSEKRWSNAAVRNAYSLLSKKRYEVAAAFFLLCEPPRIQDAVRVLAVRLGDLSLALVIARLVENQSTDQVRHEFTTSQANITSAGYVTKLLLEQEVLPLFRQKRDVWLESCALWWLEDFEQARTVLLPQFQEVDVCEGNSWISAQDDLVSTMTRMTHFFTNLTSFTVYFQHLHSNVNSLLLSWARKKMHEKVISDEADLSDQSFPHTRSLQLISMADIEHAFSFVAYVCKRSGLSDTALVEMLQARHLINLHARLEISMGDACDSITSMVADDEEAHVAESVTSPRFLCSVQNRRQGMKLASFTAPNTRKGSKSQRRMSFLCELNVPQNDALMTRKKARPRSNSISWYKKLQPDKPIPTAPWLKAHIADIECRRWASSAFVGKMIGIRVAREMISYFRTELDMCFRQGDRAKSFTCEGKVSASCELNHQCLIKLHKEFLNELCTPLCEQFQVDRNYVYEAALAVMHPHAYLHIVEVCFLLSELGRLSTLRKWVEYVSLSVLQSCSTFASCSITEDVYRDWEGLTIQLCYLLNLDSERQICLPARVVAHISVAVRTGIVFLGWARQLFDVVFQAITLPFCTQETLDEAHIGDLGPLLSTFAFVMNLRMLCNLLHGSATKKGEMRKTRILEGNLGYTFLGAVASGRESGGNISVLTWEGTKDSSDQNQIRIQKMYALILMVSVIRSLCVKAKNFLNTCQGDVETDDAGSTETDIASSLFTPQKLWKALDKDPVEGLQRWGALIESHLRCEFDYSVKEVPCVCGLYGLDSAIFKVAALPSKGGKVRCQASNYKYQKQSLNGVNDSTTSSASAAVPAEYNDEANDDPRSLLTFLHHFGMSMELHTALINSSDDYLLLLMQNADVGVQTTLRRFRIDPRVYVKSFTLRDALNWFARHKFFHSKSTGDDTIDQMHRFLNRCCKQRKLRLLRTHRSEDAHIFPSNYDHANIHEAPLLRAGLSDEKEKKNFPDAFYLQSMMFVNPWEVEAERNVRRYMHNARSPLLVELGWDRLSPMCSEISNEIVANVLKDPDLVAMWKATGAESWLVTTISQYRIDGLHSYRTVHQHLGLGGRVEPQIPFFVEIYSHSQRNAMFELAGLPHRFIGVVTVEMVEAKELIACSWIGNWSDPYVFLELCHANDNHHQTAVEWSLQTYRSSVGEGGVNPRWSPDENKFVFFMAIPTHANHISSSPENNQYACTESCIRTVDTQASRLSSQIWNAEIKDFNRDAVDALEWMLPSVFAGPPSLLQCTVYQKNKFLSHQFMGRAKIRLNELTPGSPIDCWLPLEDVSSGALHLKISLSFQLMCSLKNGHLQSNMLP
ncbi:putative RAVE complex protein Rav1 [Plasmopara halstedii]